MESNRNDIYKIENQEWLDSFNYIIENESPQRVQVSTYASCATLFEVGLAATTSDLALTIHPHPTLSETVMEAAELYLGHPAHTISKK